MGEQNFVGELMNLKVTRDGEGGDSASMEQIKNRDELYDSAIEVVIREGRGSCSLLQRCLGIGYGRAAKLIDFMAEDGIVGQYNGSKAREVTMTMAQWQALQGIEVDAEAEAEQATPADPYVTEAEDEEDEYEEDEYEEDDYDEDEAEDRAPSRAKQTRRTKPRNTSTKRKLKRRTRKKREAKKLRGTTTRNTRKNTKKSMRTTDAQGLSLPAVPATIRYRFRPRIPVPGIADHRLPASTPVLISADASSCKPHNRPAQSPRSCLPPAAASDLAATKTSCFAQLADKPLWVHSVARTKSPSQHRTNCDGRLRGGSRAIRRRIRSAGRSAEGRIGQRRSASEPTACGLD